MPSSPSITTQSPFRDRSTVRWRRGLRQRVTAAGYRSGRQFDDRGFHGPTRIKASASILTCRQGACLALDHSQDCPNAPSEKVDPALSRSRSSHIHAATQIADFGFKRGTRISLAPLFGSEFARRGAAKLCELMRRDTGIYRATDGRNSRPAQLAAVVSLE